MCGLWAYFLRSGRLFDSVDYVRHEPWKHASANRGPDSMTEVKGSDYHLCFHRLAIHDISSNGDQPFYMEWESEKVILHLMCNGEIYNYEDIVDKYNFKSKLKSTSDCEIICHLLEYYHGNVAKVVEQLDGEYAFVARMEYADGKVLLVAARDQFGVRPLYFGSTSKGIVFSSMLSGIVGIDDDIKANHFPPGHTYCEWLSEPKMDIIMMPFSKHPLKTKMSNDLTKPMHEYYKQITDAFINAVKKRLSSEREIGFLLSGGLDSSLVLAVATKILGYNKPRSFTIVFDKNATDLEYARMVSKHLNVKNTEIHVQPEEALEIIPEVIRALETYDITTIRASTPQYLLAQYIAKDTHIRVILNGDGSDEVACGYLYHHNCPSDEDAQEDTIRLLKDIHMYDGLRVDRTLGGNGLEARLPFLDIEYVSTYLSIPIQYRRALRSKGRMEKQLLRDAFATLYPDILPREVLYRTKEAFSDAVSSTEKSWYEMINEFLSKKNITEEEWYKQIFNEYIPNHSHIIPYYWLPRWSGFITNPSARVLNVYK